ncbi:MAG: hypothetical protein IT422_16470 [Pirellulaceae bacterium]|nr:hypothetical protein [Pirellulaceae bacterium]
MDTSGKLTITVATASEFSPDIVVTLYDNAGNQLKRVDNEGVGITGTTEVLAFEGVVQDQRLLVRVGSKGYGTSGPYTIDVNFDIAPLTEYFYATDIASHRLVQIDPSNGHVIDVGIPVPGQTLAGLALTNSGALFGHLAYSEFGGNSLYEIDRLTGTGRLVGSIGMDVGGGLAYDPNRNRIYAISRTGGQLIRISQTTGQGFTIGSGNSGLDSPGAAAFDTDQDRLIVFDDADNEFYEFNPSNGNAILLSVATTSLSSFAMTAQLSSLNSNSALLTTSLQDHQEQQNRFFSCPSCFSWLIQLPILQVRERLQFGLGVLDKNQQSHCESERVFATNLRVGRCDQSEKRV